MNHANRKWLLASVVGLTIFNAACTQKYGFTPKAPFQEIETAEADNIRLAPRELVASTLRNIFGTAANAVVASNVSSRYAEFGGGPCNLYGDCPPLQGTTRDPVGGSSNLNVGTLPALPQATTSRMAQISLACDRIGALDNAVTHAARIVLGSTANVTEITDENILGLWSLFYADRELPADQAAALKDVARAASELPGATPLEAWRFVLITLCKSGYWMVP